MSRRALIETMIFARLDFRIHTAWLLCIESTSPRPADCSMICLVLWLGLLPDLEIARVRVGRRRSEGTVNFLLEERGQDVVEYTLLLAFVVLV